MRKNSVEIAFFCFNTHSTIHITYKKKNKQKTSVKKVKENVNKINITNFSLEMLMLYQDPKS